MFLTGLTLRFVLVLFASLRAALYSRTDLVIENLALRQQLAVLAHTGRRGRLTGADRLFWVTLRRVWMRWSDVLVLVKPETVIKWHRAGFRKYWTWLSRRQRTGRPSIDAGLRELILRMVAETRLGALPAFTASFGCWGSPSRSGRSQGISLVSGPVPARSSVGSSSCATHREVIAAMDFFTVPTATFRILYVWFAIDHARRRILHFDVTDRPAAAWVVQQLREAFPHDSAPTSHLRPRHDLLWPGGFNSGGSRLAPDENLLQKPVAERCR